MRRATVVLALLFSAALAACRDQASDFIAPRQHALAGGRGGGGTTIPPTVGLRLWEISSGANHSCVMRLNGTVFCWGLNDSGQVGIGSQTERCASSLWCSSIPRQVVTATFAGAQHIAAGGNHTCATSLSIGDAWCWGANRSGEVGNGTTNGIALSPSWVVRGIVFQSIAAGESATCGTSDGNIACWGKNFGKTTVSSSPTNVYQVGGPGYFFSSMTLGRDHACTIALPSNNAPQEVRCFGASDFGQTGVVSANAGPFTLASFSFGARPVAGGTRTCAVTQSLQITCIGLNSSNPGFFGNPSFMNNSSTTPVIATSPAAFVKVSVGENHACGIDLNSNAWCWGLGFWGALGGGNESNASVPQLVVGGHRFTGISVGWRHTCAIGDDNRVWCWGDNWFGQLGNAQGSTNGNWKSSTPVLTSDF